MKILSVFLIVIAALVGSVVLIPIIGIAMALTLPFAAIAIWLLPIVIILCSDRTSGAEKLAWVLAIVFLSWFAWIFYFLLAPLKERESYRYEREYRRYRYY